MMLKTLGFKVFQVLNQLLGKVIISKSFLLHDAIIEVSFTVRDKRIDQK